MGRRHAHGHTLASTLALAICLAWTSKAVLGCNQDLDELLGTEYYESRVAPGPARRSRKKPDARCYDSFDKFKKNEDSAGEGMEWHHIVPQHPANERKFGKRDLHCTDNLIRIPRLIHQRINGHYASKLDIADGKTVRDWQAEKTFDEQYEYGIDLLRKHGMNP